MFEPGIFCTLTRLECIYLIIFDKMIKCYYLVIACITLAIVYLQNYCQHNFNELKTDCLPNVTFAYNVQVINILLLCGIQYL